MIPVLIVDDQESFRRVLRELVDESDGFELVGEAPSGELALQAVAQLGPRVVIMDKRMPGIGGVEATRLLTARHPEVAVLLVSIEEPDPELTRASGAAAFVRKQELSRGLLRDFWRQHGR